MVDIGFESRQNCVIAYLIVALYCFQMNDELIIVVLYKHSEPYDIYVIMV